MSRGEKIALALIVGVLLLFSIALLGDKKDGDQPASEATPAKQYKFDERTDKQPTDQEAAVNEPATVDGRRLTITGAERRQSVSDFEQAEPGQEFVVGNIQIENTAAETKSYNPFDFKIQTTGGQLLDTTFGTVATPLNSGELTPGGKVMGNILFKVPVAAGPEYVIWKPNTFKSERAVVKIK